MIFLLEEAKIDFLKYLIIGVLSAACDTNLDVNPNNKPDEVQTECVNYSFKTNDDSNTLLGNPDGAKPCILYNENYLLDQTYFVQSYNSKKSIPNWVSWHLSYADFMTGSRGDFFSTDEKLPLGFYKVKPENYMYSTYGFDRGHNCPSGDRTTLLEANKATFLMTNMIPQAPNNNQGPWADLETYIRNKYVKNGYEAYIIMGNYGVGGNSTKGSFETINNGLITVPANIWKIAIILKEGNNDINRITENTIVLAVDIPNSDYLVSKTTSWKKFITSISEIEKATGYNLLSNIKEDVKKQLQNKTYQ